MSFLFFKSSKENVINGSPLIKVPITVLDFLFLAKVALIFLLKKEQIPIDISSFQPENPFQDILIFPLFSNLVRHLCLLDESRLICGDDNGNLTIWNVQVC